MMGHTCNPTTCEGRQEGQECKASLSSESETRLSYNGGYLKKTKPGLA